LVFSLSLQVREVLAVFMQMKEARNYIKCVKALEK
jgi:hypothetical protein